MKKLLILAYDFPPYVSVGGLRPYCWFKYLKEFGVEPVVITRNWINQHGNSLDYIIPSSTNKTVTETIEQGTMIKTPYAPTWSNRILLKYGEHKHRFIRRVFTAIGEVKQFIRISGPKKNLFVAADEYLKNNKVDAIVATGDPFVLFYYASLLSKKYNIPWMADYRDPWSHDKEFQKNRFYYLWNKGLERKIVSTAKAIITVSDFFSGKLKDFFPAKPIHILPNGYDPEVIERIVSVPQSTKKLTFSFVGSIYKWYPWKSFLTIFSGMIEQNNLSIQLNMYGINMADEIEKFISTLPSKTQQSISINQRLPNEELLNKLAGENVMLLFNNYSMIGTKIFDYIGARRKIILCYQHDMEALKLKEEFYSIEEDEKYSMQLQEDLIRDTHSGVIVENENHLRTVLRDLVKEFEVNGKIECNSIGIENYSRKIQAKKLADIVKQLS